MRSMCGLAWRNSSGAVAAFIASDCIQHFDPHDGAVAEPEEEQAPAGSVEGSERGGGGDLYKFEGRSL